MRGVPCFAPRLLFLSSESDLQIQSAEIKAFSPAPRFALCLPSEHVLLHQYRKFHGMGVVLYPWAVGLLPFLNCNKVRNVHNLSVLNQDICVAAENISISLGGDMANVIEQLNCLFEMMRPNLPQAPQLTARMRDLKPYIGHFLTNPACKLDDCRFERRLALGERTLNRRFLQMVGVNTGQFMRASRYFHILSTLSDCPQRRLYEIQEACGFESRSQFHKVLKQMTGVIPSLVLDNLDPMTKGSISLMDSVRNKICKECAFV